MKRIDRSFTLFFVLATLVVVAAPGCAARRARSPDLADPTLKDAGLARYWTADVPIPSGDSLAKVYLVDDTLYLYTLNGIVFAVQADTGLIRWGKKLSARNLSIQKPGHITATPGYSLAAFVTPGGTQILDRYTGETIASFPNEFAVGGAPVGVGDTLFMGSADGNVYALVWHTAGSGETIQWWTVRAGGPVTAAPILYGGDRLIVASQGGHVFSFFANDKALVWSRKTGGAVLGDPVLDGDEVVVASTDRSIYKFDAENGSLLWRHRTDSPLADSPVVVDHAIYQYSSRQGLLALDADTGREKWRAPHAKYFVAQVEDRVAVWDGRGEVLLLDRNSGEIMAEIPVPIRAEVVTNTLHDAIYFVEPHGRVECLRPRGVPYLHPSKIASARARLNRSPQSQGADSALDRPSGERSDSRSNDPFRSRRDAVQPP